MHESRSVWPRTSQAPLPFISMFSQGHSGQFFVSSTLPPEKLFQQSQVLLVVNPQLGCIETQQTRVGDEPEKRIPKIWEIISSETQAAAAHCTHNNPITELFSEFRWFIPMELAAYTTHSHLHSEISKLN